MKYLSYILFFAVLAFAYGCEDITEDFDIDNEAHDAFVLFAPASSQDVSATPSATDPVIVNLNVQVRPNFRVRESLTVNLNIGGTATLGNDFVLESTFVQEPPTTTDEETGEVEIDPIQTFQIPVEILPNAAAGSTIEVTLSSATVSSGLDISVNEGSFNQTRVIQIGG